MNTTQQVGGALGLAVLANVSASHINRLLGEDQRTVTAVTSGYQTAFAVSSGLVVAAVVLVVAALRPRVGRPADVRAEHAVTNAPAAEPAPSEVS